MDYILTYDLERGHTQVKKYLLEKGYREEIATDSGNMKLPNTTLIGDKPNSKVVSADFKEACNAYNATCLFKKDKIKNSSHFVIKIDYSDGWIENN